MQHNKTGVVMKNLKIFLLILLLVPCFLLGGCAFFSNKIYVTDISKQGTEGNITTYTITYSDGSTSALQVENGKDGEDLSLEVVQEYCEQKGITLDEYFQSLKVELNSVEKAANKALLSAVSIIAVSPYQTGSTYYSRAGGSGVIYKMNPTSNISYIITNYHVVESDTTASGIASEIKLFQYGADMTIQGIKPHITNGSNYYYSGYNFSSSAISATYIGGSNTYDIAVLKVETDDLLAVNPKACPVTVATNYTVAETAIAVGNPNAAGMSVTTGIVSVESETLTLDGINYRVMRMDTPVNPGNSGGGLFNDMGELIGIVNAKMESITIDNIAYAIPFDNAIVVADNIIDNYSTTPVQVTKLYLGVTPKVENSHAVYDPTTKTSTLYDEFVIDELDAGGVGDVLGLEAGDKITSIVLDGETYNIRRYFQVADLLIKVRVGSSIKFIGTRNGVANQTLAESNSIFETQLITVD